MQFGCGFRAPAGWLNFDASPTLLFERIPILGSLYTRNARRFPENVRYGDITKGLPIGAMSCDGIYCSHVLEHLPLEGCHAALRNTHAYLKPGGIFRLVVPDLRKLATDYLDHRDANRFMTESGLGRTRHSLLRDLFGHGAHLWLWDHGSMSNALRAAGFVDIRAAEFNDSRDPKFSEVEEQGRFLGCLALECRRPAGPVP